MQSYDYLTDLSRKKVLEDIPLFGNIKESASTTKVLSDVNDAFYKKIRIKQNKTDIASVISSLKAFDKRFGSFDYTNYTYSISLTMDNNLTIHFLSYKDDSNTIVAILHAINIICIMYPKHMNKWTIYVRLDDTARVGFSVSGLTSRGVGGNFMIYTKREEIVKVTFHEMIHCLDINHDLGDMDNDYDWNVRDDISLEEAHTELLATVIHSAYVSIHLSCVYGFDLQSYYYHILNIEYEYSFWLLANILKHFGTTPQEFLKKGNALTCDVQIWSYAFVRSIGFTRLDKIMKERDYEKVRVLFQSNKDFDEKLVLAYGNTSPINSLSYIAVDIDYDKLLTTFLVK